MSTLELLRKVRTSDLTDALDSMGLQRRYEMDVAMRPLYPGTRFAGIATTEEYKPIDKPLQPMSYEEFDERQYKAGPDGLWKGTGEYGRPDEVIVIDAKRTAAGILGSANTLGACLAGTVGFVIDGTCRDSGECITQKTPVFCTVRSPSHPMGRLVAVGFNKSITCAGVKVNPGDFIVADDDGVVVVPRDIADEVASRAKRIQDKDRPYRLDCYKKFGMTPDDSVALDY